MIESSALVDNGIHALRRRGGMTVKPYAKINGIWDFERDDTVTASTGAVLKTGETALNLGGGLDILLVNTRICYMSGLMHRGERSPAHLSPAERAFEAGGIGFRGARNSGRSDHKPVFPP